PSSWSTTMIRSRCTISSTPAIRASSAGPISRPAPRPGGWRSRDRNRTPEFPMAPARPAPLERPPMPGVTLSRWTMSYFAAALVALLLGEALMAAGYGFPTADIRAPETLVVVHLLALGWLSLLMCGALFQFVPVLIARPLHDNDLPLPTLVLLIVGLAALLLGFLQLAGTVRAGFSMLPVAALLLAGGFALALWNLGRTLWTGRPLPLPARFVAVGLLS